MHVRSISYLMLFKENNMDSIDKVKKGDQLFLHYRAGAAADIYAYVKVTGVEKTGKDTFFISYGADDAGPQIVISPMLNELIDVQINKPEPGIAAAYRKGRAETNINKLYAQGTALFVMGKDWVCFDNHRNFTINVLADYKRNFEARGYKLYQ